MARKNVGAFLLVGLLVAAALLIPAAKAQNAAPPSLQEQLQAQYTLSKLHSDGSAQPAGTVLVIQVAGIRGVPLRDLTIPTSVYKDGVLHPPTGKARLLGSMVQGATYLKPGASGPEFRPLPVGDKVYVSKLDVDSKSDRIEFVIDECATCAGFSQPAPYKAAVSFQFAKGSLATTSVPDVEDTIAKVFSLDTGTAEAQPAQPEPQAEQAGPPQSAPMQGLTNDDVMKMVRVKLADAVIIAKINSSACSFDTSVDDLAKLKQAGVSDAVLEAMVKGESQPTAAPPASAVPDTGSLPTEPPATNDPDSKSSITAFNDAKQDAEVQFDDYKPVTVPSKRGAGSRFDVGSNHTLRVTFGSKTHSIQFTATSPGLQFHFTERSIKTFVCSPDPAQGCSLLQ